MSTTAQTAKPKSYTPWFFFAATFAQMIGNSIFGSYLSYYMTERLLISVVLMGAVLLAVRAVDLLIGIACGAIVQKLQLKYGQYRSWLLYGPFVVGLGDILCFVNPNVPIAVKAVIVFIGYLFVGTAMSFLQLSQSGMLSKIASADINMRLNISSRIVQGQYSGRIIASMITMPLIIFFDSKGADGYTVMQLMFSVVSVAGQLLLFAAVKSYDSYDPEFKTRQSASVKLTSMFAQTLKNPQLIALMCADALRATVLTTMNAMHSYYYTYAVGNTAGITLLLTVSSVVSLVASFIALPISKKIGKKNSGILAGTIATVSYAGLGLFAHGSPTIYMIFTSTALIGVAIITACGVNLYIDCAEYQTFNTGKDNKTFAMSMYGVTTKLGFFFSSVVVSVTLSASGYDNIAKTVSKVGTLESLIGLVPAALYLCYTLIIGLVYKITEAKSKEYAAANAEAAAAAKAAQAATSAS